MRNRYRKILICLLLGAATIIVYWQVKGFDFITLDDRQYILENDALIHATIADGIKWAFTTFYASNWHPLTWISHMTDVRIFGLNPGMHHVTSVIFHILNALLLFLVLERMTGASWRSAAVAALFAVHPLHVESVAWIAERKDVLSAFFWMLTMLVYLQYAHKRTLKRYLVLIIVYILGLMSKPMLVTLPFVLLLLDYWPLNRLKSIKKGETSRPPAGTAGESEGWDSSPSALILEKIPLFACAAISSVITLLAQKSWGAVSSLERIDFSYRIANVVTSYATYLWKTVWPVNLAIFYPYSEVINPIAVLLCSTFLVLVTVWVLLYAFRLPYLVVGWLWYLGTMVPVIGIVQVGSQSMADRYTYIPLIGIFIMLAWGLFDLSTRWRRGRAVLGAITAAVLMLLLAATWVQVGHWKDSATLWRHAAAVTKGNYKAYTHLGFALTMKGDVQGAAGAFQRALEIKPTAEAYNALGTIYSANSQEDQAIECFSKGLQIEPSNASLRNNLGILLMSLGRADEAIAQFSEVLKINTMDAKARFNLGKALLQKGSSHKAILEFNEVLRINPRNTDALNYLEKAVAAHKETEASLAMLREALKSDPQNPLLHTKLGDLYFQQGEYDESINHYQKAISIEPGGIHAMFRLALVHSVRNEPDKALAVLQDMRRIEPDNPEIYYNIACIYAKKNEVETSVAWLKQAIEKGFSNYDLIRKDPDLANIRNTPFIKDLMMEH